jgi:hypothetical protein
MAEAAGKDQIRAPRVPAVAGHSTWEKSSPSAPRPSRRAARRG